MKSFAPFSLLALGFLHQSYSAVIQVRQGSSTTPTLTTTSTPVAAPGETQADVAPLCDRWDQITSDAYNCDAFVALHPEISVDLLQIWNPSIGPCNNLWNDYWICTRIAGFPTVVVTPTPTNTPAPTAIRAPGITQGETAATCNRWDKVPVGGSCQTFMSRYPGLQKADFRAWNPSVGDSCFMLAFNFVCTSIVGFQIIPPGPTPTLPPATGVPAPGPTQEGVTTDCQRWDIVHSDDTCTNYIDAYGLTLEQLVEWNPAIGSGCTNLWEGYYVCTGV